MSQSNAEQSPETRTQETRTFIRQVRAASRRKYTPEEKIRIVLEGFRREVAVSDLCRREGIRPGTFYAWTKEFMEAGKERLIRDTIRDATRQEIGALKRENHERSTGTKKRPFRPWKTPPYEPPGEGENPGSAGGHWHRQRPTAVPIAGAQEHLLPMAVSTTARKAGEVHPESQDSLE